MGSPTTLPDALSEIDRLRGQVHELLQLLQEDSSPPTAAPSPADDRLTDHEESARALRELIEGTDPSKGEEFFASVVRHLAAALKMKYAVIWGFPDEHRDRMRSLAVWAGDRIGMNFEAPIHGTPCGQTVQQRDYCGFPSRMRQQFPNVEILDALGVESYFAAPLFTPTGQVAGNLVVMHDTARELSADHVAILKLFAARAGAELARRHAEQERAQALADLKNIMESVPDLLFTLDVQGNLVRWNSRAEIVSGYTAEELRNQSALAFVHPEERERTAVAIQQTFMNGYAELEGHLLTKDQRTIPYHWTGAVLKNPDGGIIGITGMGRDVSDKRRAEEELRQQRRHLVDAQALAHLGSWDWNIDTGEILWSDELFRIFGHEPGAIAVTYDTFLTALHPDDHDPVLAAINDALLGKRPYDMECRIVRPNSDVRFIHARGEVHRDAAGHPVGMAGTALDITERKQAEEALRTSEERWELAVRGSNDGIWDWDIRTGEVFFSSRWKAMRGFEDHELTNHVDEWRSRIHPDDLDRVLQNIDAYLAMRTPEFREEYRVQRKDGSYMWILDRGVALWSADGTPTRMTGSETDITERKRMEQALRESEERFSLAAAGSTDALWDAQPIPGGPWYAPQVPIWWSPRIRELLGLEESDSFGTLQDWATRLHPEDKDSVFGKLAAHIEHRVPYDAEYRLRTNHGDYRWIRGRGQATWNEDGQPVRMSGSCQDITGQKLTERALRESEERYRTLVELSPSGVFVFNDGQTVYLNQTGARLMGASDPKDILERPTFAFIHPDYHQEVRENVHRLLTGGTSVHRAERIYLKLDGTPVPVQVEAARITWNGKPAILGLFSDITERKKAEEAIREAELRYRTIFEQAGAGVAQIESRTGRFIQINRRYCEIVGLTEAEMLATTFAAITHPDDMEIDLENMARLLQGEITSFTIEKRYVRNNGSIVWVNLNVAPLWRPGQVPTHHIAIVEDITERKRAEEALRTSRENLRQALQASNTGLWGWNTETNEVSFSREWKRQLGYEESELPDRFETWESRLHPEDHDRTVAYVRNYLEDPQGDYQVEFRLRHRDGSYRWIAARASFVPEADGRRVRLLGSHTDITERKRAEEALRLAKFSVDRAADAVYWIDPHAKILDVNEAASLMLAYSKDELCAMSVHDLNPNFQADMWLKFWAESRQRGTMVIETFHRAKDGRHIPVEVSVNYLSYEGREYHCAFVRDITDRKRAEETLMRSRDLLKSFVEHTPVAVAMLDRNLRYVAVSKRWLTDYRLGDQELIGRHHYDVFPEIREMQEWQEIHRRCLSGAVEQREEDHWIRADGTDEWTRWEVRPWHDVNGEIGGIIMFTEVVTERMRAKEALQASEERFRRMFEDAGIGMALTDMSGRFLQANRSFSDLSGYGMEELQQLTFMDITCPEDLPKNLEFFKKAQAGTVRGYQMEKRYRHKDGHLVWVSMVVSVVHENKGEPRYVIAQVQDITEHKRAEAALAQSEHQLRTVLDTLPVGVWVTDRSGKPLLANPAAKEIWSNVTRVGLHTSENPSGWWEPLGSSGEPHRWALSRALTNGASSLNETLELECLDGTRKTIRNTTVPVQDKAGDAFGALVLNEDITALRQAQEALKLTQFSVDHAVEGFFWIDLDAKILQVNDAACRMLEYSQEELTAMTVHDIDPNFPPERWSAHWEELKHKGSMTFESKHWSKTGRVLETEVTLNFLRYDGREYNCAIMRDVGERKRGEAALRASEELFAKAFRASPYPIVLSELDTGRLIDTNQASFDLFGYRREEVSGHTTDEIGLWPTPEHRRRFVAHLIRAGSIRNLEVSLRNSAGDLRQCLISAELIELYGKQCMVAVGHDITEQKRAEEALRASEERYRSLVDNAPIGIFVNEGGRFVYVNREMQRILKAENAEQLLGAPVLDRIAPEYHEMVQGRIRELMENRRSVPALDEQYLRLDGSRVDVAVTAIPASFDGNPMIQVLVLDITERKRAEEALREKHALLSAIMDTATDIIFVKDLQGRYLLMNPAGARAVGMSVEDVVGKDDDAIWPADLAVCCKAADQHIRTSGTAQTMEESTTVDGTRITYLTTKAPYYDAAGRMIGIIGVAHDITQIKRSEDELRRSHTFLRQVIDIDPNFIFAKDRTGRFTLVNKAVADAYGTTVDQLIGKTDADFNANPDEVEFFRQKDLEVMDSLHERFMPEEVITDSTGKTRWLQTVKRPILDDQGRATMVLGASTDITERKRMEETLRQRERDLRAAIEERERISQDLHDGILQSLYAVGLGLESCKPLMRQRKHKQATALVEQAVGQLNHVMAEVRNFIAGLESEVLQGRDFPTTLQSMVQTMTTSHPIICRLAIDKRASQHISTEQALHLLNIVREALSNSLRHGRATQARISLKLLDGSIRLSVSDNGTGFHPDRVQEVGHGLANMAARAQRMGGRFAVRSKPKQGTRITLDIPTEEETHAQC